MRTQTFLDFSVVLSEHADSIVNGTYRLDEKQLQKFWVQSRVRFDCWGLKLKRCTHQLESSGYLADAIWRAWQPFMEEILVSETVTRVWAAMLHAIDDQLGWQEYSPIGRSVVLSHKDARRRVLRILLRGQQAASGVAQQLNQTRINTERWVDLLLASVSPELDLERYGFEAKRLANLQRIAHSSKSRHHLIGAAASYGLPAASRVGDEHRRHHTQIHASILGCLGPELFQPTTGQVVSGWQARMYTLTDDKKGVLKWLTTEEEAEVPQLTGRRWT